MLSKRMAVTVFSGALLGVVCIIGASLRSETGLDATYLFSFWYNRVLMGVAIGLAGKLQSLERALLRGALLGFLVSFAFYSSTGFGDAMGFGAGIVYGVIIELAGHKLTCQKQIVKEGLS